VADPFSAAMAPFESGISPGGRTRPAPDIPFDTCSARQKWGCALLGPRVDLRARPQLISPQTLDLQAPVTVARRRRFFLQMNTSEAQVHTTENRGVPGSSPGLAIG
jgi:hypothetical protein